MKIQDLIKQLEELYYTYDDEYKEVMGEPEIVIDIFSPQIIKGEKCFKYEGFSQQIVIQKTEDGVYDIINAFSTGINKDLS